MKTIASRRPGKSAQALGYIDEDADDIPMELARPSLVKRKGLIMNGSSIPLCCSQVEIICSACKVSHLHTLSEVTCNVPDEGGSFILTPDMVADAMDYAQRHGAGGAIFYFSRTTTKDLVTLPVRDRFDQLRDASEVRLISSSVELGRFWWDQ